LSELSEKYRDRAKERREGATTDFTQNDARNSTSGYRAVAPDVKSGYDTAERRRQLIQESKFLGGDLQHTHLVKGLDYALLQKVRSEITHQEQVEETEIEKMIDEKIAEKIIEKMELERNESDESEIKTVLGKNIHRLITTQRSKNIERNEMFVAGRMAYLVELEDENAETDIPTTIIRSKAETQASAELNTLNTNDIVVNKLTQIFSYLRQGGKKKNKKRDKGVFKVPEEPVAKPSTSTSSSSKSRHKEEDSIYGDIGDYKPSRSKDHDRGSDRDRYRERSDRRERRHYDDDYGHSSKSSSSSSSRKRNSYFDKPNEAEEAEQGVITIPAPPKLSTQLLTKLHTNEPDSYAECYPGLQEMDDAIIDSDDEADYSKMDKGNKKGPIGRWDFDTPEEYSDYMSTKEALPKAAFQYGLKMSDGRKTRKTKTDMQKIDQEWQKIQKIITKRKGDGESGSGDVDFKKAKN
jgi:IK cytokine